MNANEIDFGPVSIGTLSNSEGDRDALGVVALTSPSELLLSDGAIGRLAPLATLDGGLIRHVVADSVELGNADYLNLARLKGCTGFDFDDTPLGDTQLALFAGLPITFLTVGGTGITDVGMATIASLRSLETLFLNRTEVTDAGLAELADMASLVELTAQLPNVTPSCASTLRNLPSLASVALAGMNDEVLRAIAKPALVTAYISRSTLGSNGLAALATESSIETLVMATAELAPGALGALTEAHQLRNLGLSRSSVRDEDLEFLSMIPGVAAIDLSGTAITDGGVARLAGCLAIEGLDLSGTAVTDEGIAALKELPLLADVNVGDTAVTQAGLDQLPHLPKAFVVEGI